MLIEAKERYAGDLPIYILGNGAAFPDRIDADGRIRDEQRIAYLRGYLGAVLDAIAAGVPVRGYFVRSLLDGFEWAHGYSGRFGLVHVDFATLRAAAQGLFLFLFRARQRRRRSSGNRLRENARRLYTRGSSLDLVAHVIQVALTPIFLLSGIATLLNVFATRLARVADLVAQITKMMEDADPDQSEELARQLIASAPAVDCARCSGGARRHRGGCHLRIGVHALRRGAAQFDGRLGVVHDFRSRHRLHDQRNRGLHVGDADGRQWRACRSGTPTTCPNRSEVLAEKLGASPLEGCPPRQRNRSRGRARPPGGRSRAGRRVAARYRRAGGRHPPGR